MPQKKTQQTISTGMLYRDFSINTREIDEEKRTVALSFSSEEPVNRWFGKEILSHKKGHVDLSFLASGRAPLLREHWRDEQIGVIDSAEIGKDNKGRAVVRFGNSPQAAAEFQDIKDGIRANVSVGYNIRKMVLEKDDEKEGRTYRATDWMPMEVSIVSIPADTSVGVGRSGPGTEGADFETIVEDNRADEQPKEEKKMPENDTNIETIKADLQKKHLEDVDKAKRSAVADVREILALGDAHGMSQDATRFINDNKSAAEFKNFVLAELAKKGLEPVETKDPQIGLTKKEKERFSFLRAIRALTHPGNKAFLEAAAFEFECSRAVEEKTARTAKGLFIPSDVLMHGQRDLQVGDATAGGYLVGEGLQGQSFIDLLTNTLAIAALGATRLSDLVGDLAIPKQTGGATAYWVGEGGNVTESTPTMGQVALRPKTVGAFTDLTRKLILQSSIDVEAFVRMDLARSLALAIDLAALAGTGADGQPMGILNVSGIGAVTLTTANTPTHGEMCDIEAEVAVDNALAGNLAYTSNATIAGKMKQTDVSTSTGRWVLEGDRTSNGYRYVMSNQVTAKYILFGNWTDLIMGMWSGVDVNVDTATLSASGGVRVVCLQDVDVAVRHPESFAYGYKA